MRKSDKKIDRQICSALTDVCEDSLKTFQGFQWLTHFVNYADFPNSLRIVCVFDTKSNLNNLLISEQNTQLQQHIQHSLRHININLQHISKHIEYDTEEACDQEHNGKWNHRFK